jgi:hypothetical protein
MIRIPIRTVSEANQREHWRVRNQRTGEHRALATMFVNRSKVPGRKPARVLLRRVGAKLLDDDNLRGSMKACRDGIADAFQTDDSPTSGIEWQYDQRRGKPPCVEVEIFYE